MREHYPSPRLLKGKIVEKMAGELISVSYNRFSARKCQKMLDAVKAESNGKILFK